MTPTEFKAAREKLGLSQEGLAQLLGMGSDGGRTVRRWEAPEGTSNARLPNPIACTVVGWLIDGTLPRSLLNKA